jgi:hypothetical protein
MSDGITDAYREEREDRERIANGHTCETCQYWTAEPDTTYRGICRQWPTHPRVCDSLCGCRNRKPRVQ